MMKILFLHGFYASGQCVPAVALKEALEGKAEVLTPDLPMHPDCHWRGVSGSYFLTYRIIDVKSQKVYKALNTDIRKLLSQEQKQAMASARCYTTRTMRRRWTSGSKRRQHVRPKR